jgi:rare lipoprotein A
MARLRFSDHRPKKDTRGTRAKAAPFCSWDRLEVGMPASKGMAALLLASALAACAAPGPPPARVAPGFSEVGLASWYGPGFRRRRTADGERFNTNGLTAAHRSLPLGAEVKVTNLENGRSVIVRINDRGPYLRGRIIDLSAAAARALGMRADGLVRVRIELVSAAEAQL